MRLNPISSLMNKPQQRQLIKQQLQQFSGPEREHASRTISQRILDLPEFHASQSILLFAPFPSEPNIRSVFEALVSTLKKDSRTILFPRLVSKTSQLELRQVEHWEQLKPVTPGYLEPDPDSCPIINDSPIDLALIPGMAFNRHGIRLGRGGGHYDRLLAKLTPSTLRVGCFFACQELPELVQEPHDQLLDQIITEREFLKIKP